MLLARLLVLPLFCSPAQRKVFSTPRRDAEGEGAAGEGSAARLPQGARGCRQQRDSCVKPDVSRSISFPHALRVCLRDRLVCQSGACSDPRYSRSLRGLRIGEPG